MILPSDCTVVALLLARAEAEHLVREWQTRLDMVEAAENEWLIAHGHEPQFVRGGFAARPSRFAYDRYDTWRKSQWVTM